MVGRVTFGDGREVGGRRAMSSEVGLGNRSTFRVYKDHNLIHRLPTPLNRWARENEGKQTQ